MSLILNLHRLQQIDTHIDRTNARLAAIQELLGEDESLRTCTQEHELAVERCTAARSDLAGAESALDTLRIKIEQTEASLYGTAARSPKELQDLQDDLASMRRYMLNVEERLLQAMQLAEEAEAREGGSLTALQSARQLFAQRNAGLVQEQDNLQKDLAVATQERNAVIGSIPEADLQLYDRLRLQKRGLAVAETMEGSCSACGSSLTAAHIQAARSGQGLLYCPSCGRILYAS